MEASIRENLLVTMGMYAGELSQANAIHLPCGNEGEDLLANFCVAAVEWYRVYESALDRPFCDFAIEVLRKYFKAREEYEYGT